MLVLQKIVKCVHDRRDVINKIIVIRECRGEGALYTPSICCASGILVKMVKKNMYGCKSCLFLNFLPTLYTFTVHSCKQKGMVCRLILDLFTRLEQNLELY